MRLCYLFLVASVSYERKRVFGGVGEIYFFHNGRGASVVRHEFSRGGELGLWELAVLKGNPETWDIDYATASKGDVIGNLTDSEVSNVLSRIEALENVEKPLETYRT